MIKKFTNLIMLLGVLVFLGAGSASAQEFYMIGTMNGWNNSNKDYPFKTNPGNDKQYLIEFDNLSADTEFKIVHKNNLGSWNYAWGAGDNGDIVKVGDKDLSIKENGGNIKLPYAIKNVKIYFKPDNKQLWIEADKDEGVSGITGVVFSGDFSNSNSWNWNTTYPLDDNGVASCNVTIGDGKSGNFQIQEKGNQTTNYRDNVTLTLDTWTRIKVSDGGELIKIPSVKDGDQYKIEWNAKTKEVKVTKTTEGSGGGNQGVYLVGDFNNWEANENYKFNVSHDEANNRYVLKVTLPKGDNGQKFKIMVDGVMIGCGDPNYRTITMGGEYNVTNQGQEHFWINLEKETTLLFTYFKEYDGSPKIEVVEWPENMYVYGHIKSLYWDVNNREKMTSTEDGIFWAYKVDIGGQWGERDIVINPDRANYPIGDENYVGFFTEHRDGYDNPSHKFSSIEFHNQDVYQPQNGVYPDEECQVYPSHYIKQGDSYNFKVGRGLYNIKVNLNDMTVTFYRLHPTAEEEKVPTEFVWFEGKDTYKRVEKDGKVDAEQTGWAVELEDQNYHQIYLNDNKPIQVGVNETDDEENGAWPTHALAKQVVFTVWWQAPKANDNNPNVGDDMQPSTVKARAGEITSDPSASEGWTQVTGLSNQREYYLTEGSSSANDNHLITLQKEGEYVIKATLSDSATGVDSYQTPEDNYLAVTVAASDPTGVEVIGVDDSEAVYYNLQGVKVNNPDHGIFVKVVGGKAVKVVK